MVKRKPMTAKAKKEMAAKRKATMERKEAEAKAIEDNAEFNAQAAQQIAEDQAQAADLPEDPSIASVPAGVHVPSLNEAAAASSPLPDLAGYTPSYDDIESNPLYPIIKQMQEQMEKLMAANRDVTPEQKINQLAQMSGATVGNQGVTGQHYKYPVDSGYYPNPVEDLYNDATLRRFALRENFYIAWEVTGVNYEKAGITFIEPRFEVALYRYMYDDEGEPNGKMFLVGRIFLHEDEVFARLAASSMGLIQGKDFADIPELLHKMRLTRIQRWLRESFKPISVKGYAKRSTTMVINGKQVEVFDTEDVVEKELAAEQAAAIKAETSLNRNSL